ncbi:MAG: zinc-binding dehydrogenase [Oceanospirillales bacterium]|nr:zinc-binding dehydrogenase [Oceanospirillales bacterium]
MPNTFRAVVLTELAQPLQVVEGVKVPALKPGQVLIRLAYAGLCHSQLMEARGARGSDPYLPHMLGHEGSGEVLAIGEGVTKVSPGDKVVLGWIKGEGMDAGGTQYESPIGTINSGGVTTFSELTVVSENRCVPLPEGVPMDLAVLFGCALPTGAGMVMNQLKPAPGSSVAVLGLGGIGLSALIALQLFEPAQIVAIDAEPAKLELAKELGATHTVQAGPELVARVIELTDGKGVDYCLEAAGSAKTIEQGFGLVKRGGGLCLFASHPSAGERIELDPFELICGKQIQGSWGGASRPDQDIPRLAELFVKKNFPYPKLLSHSFSLDEINQALDALEKRQLVRALIRIGA